MFTLYCIDFQSEKKYVGITKQNPHIRFTQHRLMAKSGSGYVVHKAMRKHANEYDFKILRTNLSKEDAIFAEKQMIAIWNTTKNGYNCTNGGFYFDGMSEQSKTKRLESMKKHYNNPEYIDKMRRIGKEICSNPEKRKKLSSASKINWENNRDKMVQIAINVSKSYEHMAKRAKAMGGKKFTCNETGEIFGSLRECAEKHNTLKSSIHKVLKGKRKKNNNLTYSYIE